MLKASGVPDFHGVIAGHIRATSSYRTIRERGTDDWLLIATIDGSGRFGDQFIAPPRSLTLIRPATPHDYGTSAQSGCWDLLWAHFNPRPGWHDWLSWPAAADGLFQLTLDDDDAWNEVISVLNKLHRLTIGAARRREALSMNALEELLLLCDTANPQSSTVDVRVQAAVDYIAGHLADKLSLDDIAAAVHLSPSRLSHLFKTQTGISPLHYVEQRRIERAKQLLDRTGLSIREIAAEVGYDPFYLSQRFKRQTGLAPRDYRQKMGPVNGDQ